MPRAPSPRSLFLDCSCMRTTGSKKPRRVARRTTRFARLPALSRSADRKNHRIESGLEAGSRVRRSRTIPTTFDHPAKCGSTIHECCRRTPRVASGIRHRPTAHISQKAARSPSGCIAPEFENESAGSSPELTSDHNPHEVSRCGLDGLESGIYSETPFRRDRSRLVVYCLRISWLWPERGTSGTTCRITPDPLKCAGGASQESACGRCAGWWPPRALLARPLCG